MPPEKIRVLADVTACLRGVAGVAGVVLGGSHATGTARPDSDLDIGLYYREAAPFSIDQVRSIAESISVKQPTPVVTKMYEWGPWVNGGAWIQTPSGEVDFLYRNLDQVEKVIQESRQGVWRHDYDQQPPYGFRSTVYLGETLICVPLHDPFGEIARLKEMVAVYPDALRDRIIQDALWGAEFSLWAGRNAAAGPDIYIAAGCMTRAAQFLVHAVFALNRQYYFSDKSASRRIDRFAVRPTDFTSRLGAVLAGPGGNPEELRRR